MATKASIRSTQILESPVTPHTIYGAGNMTTAQLLQIHPVNPQLRLIRQVVSVLHSGGLVIYPTDSCYALGCRIGDKVAMERIRRVRHLEPGHNLSLVCADLSAISVYAGIDNQAYRLLRALTPGPYTFILKAAHGVPRRLQDPKRKTVGIRVPDHRIVKTMLDELRQPVMSSTLLLPREDIPMTDPEQIHVRLGKDVDLVIDGGYGGHIPTTVVDLVGEFPVVRRKGKGDIGPFDQ